MAGLEVAITYIENILFRELFVGQSWIMYLTIILATLLIITRNWEDYGALLLPVLVGWKYFGMPVPYSFMMGAGILFIINALSLKMITGALSSSGEKLIETYEKYGSLRTAKEHRARKRQEERINIKEEMEKIKMRRGELPSYLTKGKLESREKIQLNRDEIEALKVRQTIRKIEKGKVDKTTPLQMRKLEEFAEKIKRKEYKDLKKEIRTKQIREMLLQENLLEEKKRKKENEE